MRSLNKLQVGIIGGGLALFAILLFANTKNPRKVSAKQAENLHEVSIEKIIGTAKEALASDQKIAIANLEKMLDHESLPKKLRILDSLVKLTDDFKKPELAAHYTEEIAIIQKTSAGWFKAAERYEAAARFVKEQEKEVLFRNAIKCFSNVLSIDPENIEAKAGMGVCYVEGTPDPMKGIGLLREVVQKDSNNINAQLNLGFFSVKSGQYDKAIERFNKVLRIKPDYLEAYLFLADVYEKTGNKQKSIESLQKYMSLINDVTIKTEIQNYINKLKNS